MRNDTRYAGNRETSGSRSSALGWVILVAVFFLLVGALLVITGVEPRHLSSSQLLVSWVEIGVLLVIICGAVIAVTLMKLRKRHPASTPDGKAVETGLGTFDDRLRRVEALYRDGVIGEGEYKRKRREILDEKW